MKQFTVILVHSSSHAMRIEHVLAMHKWRPNSSPYRAISAPTAGHTCHVRLGGYPRHPAAASEKQSDLQRDRNL